MTEESGRSWSGKVADMSTYVARSKCNNKLVTPGRKEDKDKERNHGQPEGGGKANEGLSEPKILPH